MTGTTFMKSPARDSERRAPWNPWNRPRCARWLCAAAALWLLTGGCGDDEEGSSAPAAVSSQKPRPNQRQNKPGAADPGNQGDKLQFYTKVEDLIGPEEAARIRHKFQPEDFEPDAVGVRNRDPFRSYVVIQGDRAADDDKKSSSSEICKETVAPEIALRDLRLVGIVLRGTRSYALFVDNTSRGHIITKGDCLGAENARVSSVRAGFVSLEIIPEATETTPTPVPQERIIPLYPNELLVDGDK